MDFNASTHHDMLICFLLLCCFHSLVFGSSLVSLSGLFPKLWFWLVFRLNWFYWFVLCKKLFPVARINSGLFHFINFFLALRRQKTIGLRPWMNYKTNGQLADWTPIGAFKLGTMEQTNQIASMVIYTFATTRMERFPLINTFQAGKRTARWRWKRFQASWTQWITSKPKPENYENKN